MSEQAYGRQPVRNEWVVWLLLALLVAAGIVLGVVVAVTRLVCGQRPEVQSPSDMLPFFWTGEPGYLAVTAEGCAATPVAVWGTLGALAAAVVVLIIVGMVAWSRYKQGDRYFVREVRRREGIARRAELRRVAGPGATRRRGKQVRPSIKRPKAVEVGHQFGYSEGISIWGSYEDSVCLWGPPRAGKGLHLTIDAILDAPGPVVATSSRTDNFAATCALRKSKGPVAVFDPQQLSGTGQQAKWSPIAGCHHQRTANVRAWSLIRASGLGSSRENAEWQSPAAQILAALLHAAALSGQTVNELYRWSANPEEARAAVDILKDASTEAAAWGLQLEGVLDGDKKMRSNMWFGVTSSMAALAVPEYREAMTPATRADQLDVDRLLDESGTLYIMGTQTGGASVGPFLIALLDAVTERAQEKAASSTGNRLDPPLALVLDEIANLAATWPNLKNLMSAGGGSGIMPMAVFQSGSQARNQWGAGEAEAIFDNATISILLGGLKNSEDLEKVSKLIGRRRVVHRSRSEGESGRSVSEQGTEVPVLSADELRRVPFGHAVMLRRTGRAIFMKMRRWTARRDAKDIKESLAAFDHTLLTNLTRGSGAVTPPIAEPNISAPEPVRQAAALPITDASEGPMPTDPTADEHSEESESVVDSWMIR